MTMLIKAYRKTKTEIQPRSGSYVLIILLLRNLKWRTYFLATLSVRIMKLFLNLKLWDQGTSSVFYKATVEN